MNYIATMKRRDDTVSKMFKSVSQAEEWLDTINNNKENLTYIEEYDERWNQVGSFVYTEVRS